MGNSLKHSEQKKRKQVQLFKWTKITVNQKRKEGEGDGKKETEEGVGEELRKHRSQFSKALDHPFKCCEKYEDGDY